MSNSQNVDDPNLKSKSDPYPDVELPEWWKAHYREKLTSSQFSVQDILVDLIHEFLVPLASIRGYAELIRDRLPPSAPIVLPNGETFTSKDFADVILKQVMRQQLMLNFARFEAWRNPPIDEQNSQ